MLDHHPLPVALECAVRLRIAELEREGGPTDWEIAAARSFGQTLSARGDVLQFRGKRPGESAELFAGLVHAVAVLAFCPGGVTIFGAHYEGRSI